MQFDRHQSFTQGYSVRYDIPYLNAATGDRIDPMQTLDIYTPNELSQHSREARPAVIYLHGGGWEEGDKSKARERFEPLLDLGYVFISIGYRLSGNAHWPAQIDDCHTAMNYITTHAKELHIDPDKIALWGSSSGGHLACLLAGGCLADKPPKITCLVNYCAPIAVNAYVQSRLNAGEVDCPVLRLVGGEHADTLKFAEQATVLNWVQPGYPPTFIAHGEKDDVVPVGQSKLLAKAIESVGSKVNFLIIPGAAHRLEDDDLRLQVRNYFQKHLGITQPKRS